MWAKALLVCAFCEHKLPCSHDCMDDQVCNPSCASSLPMIAMHNKTWLRQLTYFAQSFHRLSGNHKWAVLSDSPKLQSLLHEWRSLLNWAAHQTSSSHTCTTNVYETELHILAPSQFFLEERGLALPHPIIHYDWHIENDKCPNKQAAQSRSVTWVA